MDTKVQKMLSFSLYVLLGIIFAFSVILVLPVYKRYTDMQKNVSDLNVELKNAQNECLTLTRVVHDLEKSGAAAEKVAREEFDFCREGEQILIYK